MNLRLKTAVILAGVLILSTSAAQAVNITIYDGQGVGTGWYGAQEDNEVEPGTVQAQHWDLEGFYLEGNTLKMVGGYDFGTTTTWKSGDIFIDVNGDASFGKDTYTGTANGAKDVTNTYGYDYAIDLNFSNNNNVFTVYSIDSDTLLTVWYRLNDASNPWQYKSGGVVHSSGNFTYVKGLTDAQAAAAGYNVTSPGGTGTHNVVSLNLQSLLSGKSFTAHYTMECGNDNLIGRVPEPGTMLLLSGFLVMSLPVIRRFGLN